MTLTFASGRFATIQTSWLDPRKVREMTIVGSKRMIVYDDLEQLQKITIYDQRVEKPPHYDTFAEFQYAYHYGDVYSPYVKQEEPLKVECRHFLDCIRSGESPITSAEQATGVVRILEASAASLKQEGARVPISAKS
jgi:predicted dehydrogenase